MVAAMDPMATAPGPEGEAARTSASGAGRGLRSQVAVAGLVLGIVVACVFALLLVAIAGLRDATRDADRAGEVSIVARDVQEIVLDAERASHGFVISDDDAFLEPLRSARRRFPARARALRGALGDGRRSGGANTPIVRDVEGYLRYADRVVAVARRSQQRGRAFVAAGEGKRRVDTLNAELSALIAAQRAAARGREDAADARARTALALAVGGIAVSGLIFALYAAYVTRSIVVPVRRVGIAAQRLASGQVRARVRDARSMRGEPGAMARSFNAMADALEHTRDELEAQNAELEAQGSALREQRRELEAYAAELEAQRSELEQTLGELEAEKARMDVSYDFGEIVAAETRFKPLADLILTRVADNADAELGLLYVRDAKRDHALALASSRGVDPADVPERVEPGVGLAGAAVAGRPVVGPPEAGGVRLRFDGVEVSVCHELHVPLVQSGSVFGVLTLARLSEPEFSAAERDLVSHLADQSAVALAKVVALRDARRREAITRAVLDAAPNAIGLFDDRGRAVLANGPMAEVIAALGEDAVPAEVSAGEVVRDELSPPGSGRVLARHTARLDDDEDTARGRLVVLRDVTAEREAERLKDEFFALVSHELRTPLTSVIGYVDLLRDEAARADAGDPAAEQRARFLGVIERNARRLLRLVSDLLFVAQVEAGRLALERADVDLAAVARESIEAAAPAAAQAGVELRAEVAEVPVLRGDRDRLAQALDNLISNALKFTPAGGRVTIGLRAGGDRLALDVGDTGMGIPAADQERLFERFYRTADATRAAIPGVGLGLSIVWAIVEGHGGRIALHSAVGEGTTFTIELPLHDGALPPHPPALAHPPLRRSRR